MTKLVLVLFLFPAVFLLSGQVLAQVCNFHAYYDCSGGAIYWFDSCGNKQDLKQDCSVMGLVCRYGQCVQQSAPVQPAPQPAQQPVPQPISVQQNQNQNSSTQPAPVAAAAISTSQTNSSGFIGFLKHWHLWIIIGAVLAILFIIVFRRLSKEA